jgi:L,D-transpeptidase ErfK/SrfK
MRKRTALIILLLFSVSPSPGWCRSRPAGTVIPPTPAPVIGENRTCAVRSGESLVELALREGVGYLPLAAANPGIDPWFPPAGQEVILPAEAILPSGVKPGITINVAEFRLYYTWQEGNRRLVRTYPIGVGVEGWETPVGEFAVMRKVKDPSWTAPASIRREKPDEPAYVPPGPDNPLGAYWMQVSPAGHGIHGTNKPLGVGRRVSHGCIRLYPDDIEELFKRVPVGTPVRILYQPIKVGLRDNRLMLEVHADFLGRIDNPLAEVVRQKEELNWPGAIDLSRLLSALREARGLPVAISP